MATTPRVADALGLRAESPRAGQASTFTVEFIDVLQSNIAMPGADGHPPIRELPSRHGESGPPAERVAVAACLATRRR